MIKAMVCMGTPQQMQCLEVEERGQVGAAQLAQQPPRMPPPQMPQQQQQQQPPAMVAPSMPAASLPPPAAGAGGPLRFAGGPSAAPPIFGPSGNLSGMPVMAGMDPSGAGGGGYESGFPLPPPGPIASGRTPTADPTASAVDAAMGTPPHLTHPTAPASDPIRLLVCRTALTPSR